MSRLRIGVSVMPLENRREALVGLATAADRHGYDAFMLPETSTYDVTVLLAEAAVKTQRITLGTCILGVYASKKPPTQSPMAQSQRLSVVKART